MLVYELSHIFFVFEGQYVLSPKKLGIFCSYADTQEAIVHYITQPGFSENQNAFSVRQRHVIGTVANEGIAFEACIYIHSEDYDFEEEIELGFYGNATAAQSAISNYCAENKMLFSSNDLIIETYTNKCVVGRKEWVEGFSVSE